MPVRRFVCLGLLLAVLSACSPKATPQPATTPAPTATRLQPTSTPAPLQGFTAEGWPCRGNPNATVTLWEFSEFQ